MAPEIVTFDCYGTPIGLDYAFSTADAERVVAEIKSQGGIAMAVQGDVRNASDIQRLFAKTKQAFGKLEVLVNNADVYQLAPLAEITEDQFHQQFNTNVLGLLLATQEAAKLFGTEGGSVINIGSTASDHAAHVGRLYSHQGCCGCHRACHGEGTGIEEDPR